MSRTPSTGGSARASIRTVHEGTREYPWLVPRSYAGRFRVRSEVWQASRQDYPVMAWAVQLSLPPSASGPRIAGWNWDQTPHKVEYGIRQGLYDLVGTWHAETMESSVFRVTEPPKAVVPDEPRDGSRAGPPEPWSGPCPEPVGGWFAVDPARATQEALLSAQLLAQSLSETAGIWLHSLLPTAENGCAMPSPEAAARFGQAGYVLVVLTTGDVDRVTESLREVWGGPLCVSGARRTEVELRAIQNELLSKFPEPLFASAWSLSVDTQRNAIGLMAVVATTDLQEYCDRHYGMGTVEQYGMLMPID